MLKVWGRHSAANVQKVMWLIGELGIDHEHIPCGGVHGGLDHPAFLALNPNGLVPVIDDDGAVVWESHAILRYLAARYGADRFWSDDPYSRSLFDRWLVPISRGLDPVTRTLFGQSVLAIGRKP